MVKIMKKSLLATLVIITMLLVFIPVNRVRATTHLDEIRFTGNLSEIVEGELGGFSIETSTECASIEDIRWVKKSGASSTWTEIEGEKRDVSVDGVTSYGLKLEVNLSNDYAFDGMTTIYYNEKDMIAETETEVEPFDGGGYVVIDLGKARKANEYILSAKTYDSDNRIEGDSTVGSFSVSYGEASTGNKNDIEVDAIENVNYIATAYPSEGFKFVEWAEFGIDEEVEKAFRVSEESTYSSVYRVKTTLPLKTAEETSSYSMEYVTYKILALAWIDIENLDEYPEHGRMTLHFGDRFDDVRKKLNDYGWDFNN